MDRHGLGSPCHEWVSRSFPSPCPLPKGEGKNLMIGPFQLILAIAILGTIIAIGLIMSGPRLVSHLMWKYLRRRRIAWWALLTVALCTTMVLVVISVMGGWLDMFEHSFQ